MLRYEGSARRLYLAVLFVRIVELELASSVE